MDQLSPPPEPAAAVSARGALPALSLAALLAALGVSIANVALPAIAADFAVPMRAAQWVVLAYLLTMTVVTLAAGRLGDRHGRRLVLTCGLALFTAMSALAAVAPTLGVLIGARLGQGAGAAVMMALTIAMVRESVAADRTGRAMGLLGTMSAVGTALGPSAGGLLIAWGGWRAVFAVLVPLGGIAIVLAWRALPGDRPSPAAKRGEGPGGLLLAAALAFYSLAMTRAGIATGAALVLAAVAATALFVIAERRAAKPLLPPAMLNDPVVRESLAMNVIVGTTMMTTLVVGPFYLSGALGLGAAEVGMVMAIGPAVAALSGVPAGRLTDRFGPKTITLAGLGEMAVAAVALALLPLWLGVAGYALALATLTPGFQLFQAANNTAVMARAAVDARGIAGALLSLSRNLGFITGASLMGTVFALAAGRGAVGAAAPEALGFAFRATFFLAAAMLAGAFVLGWRRARRPLCQS